MIDDAYHTVLMKGRFPIVMLHITVDPGSVDVNIHPTKSEVKFRDPDYVRRHVSDAIRAVVAATPAIPSWEVAPPAPEPSAAPSDRNAREQRLEYLSDLDRRPSSPPARSGGARPTYRRSDDEPLFPETPPPPQQPALPFADAQAAGAAVAGMLADQRAAQSGALPELRVIGQLAGLYILCESPAHELYIIDQHAAHERINYERLMAQAAQGSIDVQRLLIPQRYAFVPQDALLLLQHHDELQRWGFRIEDGSSGGNNDIVVHAIPVTVAPARCEAALLQIAAALRDAGGSLPADWQEQMLITLACHTSIRAGQSLSIAEQTALLTQMRACAHPRTCPHGRPTIIAMRLDAFARQFGRIV